MSPHNPSTDKRAQPEVAPAGQTACPTVSPPDLRGMTIVPLNPHPSMPNYLEALRLADAEAGERWRDYMLLSWYDRDRDFEAPQHVSECQQDAAVPGYVDYAFHHGATLKVDVEDGRFVFYYRAVEL